MTRWDGRPLRSKRYLSSLVGVEPKVLETLAVNADKKYRTWQRKKKNTVDTRPISDPTEDLKAIQKTIKQVLLDTLTPPEFCFGGIKGKSALDNATVHVGQPEVLTLDFRSFFQNIDRTTVEKMWKRRFSAGRDVASCLALLTTHQNKLPQGAPTSTGIANLVSLPFAKQVWKECQRRGYRFSLFVDDMTVSGAEIREMSDWIARLASKHGLQIARNKTKLRRRSARQQVTGYVVNRRVSVPEERVLKGRRLIKLAKAPTATPRDQARAAGMFHHISKASANQARRLSSGSG